MSKHVYSLLCLGDSYTIGEGVPLYEGFPYQLVQQLRLKKHAFHAPEIVAQTGWTTFELADYLIRHAFNEHYDFVTLLIGVNNQYRGLAVNDYADEFEFLLRKAIHFAGGNARRVVVLSIPDWGATPFARDRHPKQIASDIDTFNFVNKALAEKYHTAYFDITPQSRDTGEDPEWLAADGLHYSGKMYAAWAAEVAAFIEVEVG